MEHIISGIVVKGDGYGRKLGFPTVNLDFTATTLPQAGVYAGIATLEEETYRAGIVVGPEVEGKHKLEAHLIGYEGDAYGKVVTLEIKKFLRAYKHFATEEELINQIKKDIEQC